MSLLVLASDAEIGVQLVHVGFKLRIGKTVDNLAVLDDVVTVGHGGREPEILLDQENSKTFLLQPRDGLSDLLDDDRGQSFGRLVQHQKARRQLARQDACTPRSGDRQITNALSNKTATTSFAVASLLTLFPDEHHPN
jgi:hypothetical protein